MKIHVKELQVDAFMNMSTLNSGDTIHVNNRSVDRVNEGYGRVIGDQNVVLNGRHVVTKRNTDLSDNNVLEKEKPKSS